jgi:2-polyprenyl-3-methyl-5-hydroxy-6-metoxy-1,4-benzoquinol methylase
LALPLGGESAELWEFHENGRAKASYPMQVRLGKPFDVMRMKGQSVNQLRTWVSEARNSITALYAGDVARRRLTLCPCCKSDIATANPFAVIHGIEYRRCTTCAHVFIPEQPPSEVLNRMFAENDAYAQEYTSKDQIDQRLREIISPKLDWVRSIYRSQYGREVKHLLDVGAGGGHFVAGCRRAGLEAEGYEVNKAAVAFANATFDVQLQRKDFLEAPVEAGRHDAITFWGLLEYTPEPARFVAAARRQLADDAGLLIVEVPRAEAFGSAIQSLTPDAVWRHLSPASHVNIYSDASIATLLHDNGFKPIAAWYFGMDFYELLCQLSAALGDDRLLARLGPLVGPMQAWLDAAEFVDDLLIAAVPT